MSPAGRLEERLDASAAVVAARQALAGVEGVWIVGGTVRDALLGRPLVDLDLAIAADAEAAARAIAQAASATAFQLSEEFATWRVVPRESDWQADVAVLRGKDIEADLALRDFTINAMAVPLHGGELLDQRGGVADLDAGTLRAAGGRTFTDDPLRLMRAARIGAELHLVPDPVTVTLAQAAAPSAADPAGERQFAELRGILTGADPVGGLRLLDELEVTPVVLPELDALRGVEQNPYHQFDVYGHTLAVLKQAVELEGRLDELFGVQGEELRGVLAEPLADEITRAGALRFAALFHDIGKPATRTVGEGGRIMFLGHDRVGAEIIGGICGRLRTSRRLRGHLELLTANHLRAGFLVHEQPLSRRSVYEYLLATDPAPVDATLLTVADRLATQGPKTKPEALEAHLEVARALLREAVGWQRNGPPRPPVNGQELAAELNLAEGPELGAVLQELALASFAGEITTPQQALELARRIV